MKNENRLNADQARFLRACRDEPGTLESFVERFKLKPWRLSRWLRRSYFRQALAEVLKEVRRKRQFEFELAARQATHVQSQILVGKPGCTHLQRQASYDVLELYHQMHPQRRRSGRKAEPAAPATQESALIHPEVTPEEADRLLKEMNGAPSTGGLTNLS